ncbi:MAG: phospholipase D-like domain-containing protein [Polyangiales bacterium]
MRSALSKIAEREGHALRVLMSVDRSEPERPVPTFIHAKVLIVDDALLSVGSANLTNRSMEVDTELNASWQAEAGEAGEALRGAIRSLRGALLAEHTGRLDGSEFEPVEGLAGVIDAVCDDPTTKLKCQEIVEPEDGDPFLISIFDPSGEITFDALYEALSGDIDVHDGLLRKGARKVGQRLGVVDID